MERIRRLRRERLIGQFVDRHDEMAVFERVLATEDVPVMVVVGETGMGKSALLMRMVHECLQRKVTHVELEWNSVNVLDYLAVLRRMRDVLGGASFDAFTDLVAYYTEDGYKPRLEVNINLHGGGVQVAGGAQISGSTVGDIAGVIVRDNNFTIQRSNIPVPDEVRRENLTRHFLAGLAALSAERQVVLFFNATEKMSEITNQWLWGQLLTPVVDRLPNVRAVLLGQRPPPDDMRDMAEVMHQARLRPLGVDDIDVYIAKCAAGTVPPLDDAARRTLAAEVFAKSQGRPSDVSQLVQETLPKPQAGA